MAIPLSASTTCDIYRSGTGPPAPPAVAAVPCSLSANYGLGLEAGETSAGIYRFDHTMLVAPTTDVRDDYNIGTIGVGMDSVYIPDKNGTQFKVTFVERHGKGTASDHKKVYLVRQAVTWPSINL